MLKLISSVAAIGALFGCAVPQNNYKPDVISISEPEVGSVSTAAVGDEMLKQGKFVEQDAIYLKTPFKPSYAYIMGAGYYRKTGSDATGEFYLPAGGQESGSVEKLNFVDPWKAAMLKPDGSLCIVTVFNVATCDNGADFERRKHQLMTQDSFQQTLIYSGKIGNKINVGYREFSNSLARPAFNNNVEYDLGESKTIGYKGAQLEVLDATNQSIRYRVIRNFNTQAR